MSLIVETVTARSMAELRAGRDGVTDADMVELRLDGVADVDVAGALAGRARPVVVTCRPTWEGGRFDGSEEDRLKLLVEAMRLGAEYVDLEWRADRRSVPASDKTAVVLSHHNFNEVPGDLAERARAMRAECPAIVKIAVAPQRLEDCLRLRDLVDTTGGRQVLIAMGSIGTLTRVWPAWCRSCWTYAGHAAPGQLTAAALANCYRVRETTADTAVYAIVGRPLGHSASPAMHNAAMAESGIDAVYIPLETADAKEFLSVAEAIGVRGASVTVPLKADLAAAVPGDGAAKEIGAINTLRRTGHGWEGENFDIHGFLAPFERRGWDLEGMRTLVLGAGGAARAVIAGLVARGALVTVCARRPEAATILGKAFRVGTTPWPPSVGWDLLVNTTTVGMWPHSAEAPVDRAFLKGPRVYDLVYNPPETTLLTWAREGGAETIGGLEMLVGQACRQFEWWTGRTAPKAVMARAAREFVNDLRNEDRGC